MSIDTPNPRANRELGSGGSWIVDPATGERRLAEQPTQPAPATGDLSKTPPRKKGA